MITRPCKLQDPVKVQEIVDEYFRKRESEQEVRELKNGDKRVYRTPPSLYGLARDLGVSYKVLWEYLQDDSDDDSEQMKSETLKEIRNIVRDAKDRIIQELTEGVSLGYWTEKIVLAQLTRFGVIGETESEHAVTIRIQGSDSWSE